MSQYKTNEDIAKKIREYLYDSFLFGYEANELDDKSSFLELGILDSTGIMELVTFIEREFEVVVSDNEIIPENLDSVKLISDFVLRKLNSSENEE